MERLADWILKYRLPIILSCLLLSLPALYCASRMEAEEAFDSWFPPDDPAYRLYRDFEDQFGSDMFFIAVLKDENLFTPENLQLIADLTARLEQLKRVKKVTSLTNVEYVYGRDGTLVVEPLVERVPQSADGLGDVRRKAIEKALYRNTLISGDGTTTAILGELHDIETVREEEELVDSLSRIINEVERETGKKLFLAGFPVLDVSVYRASLEDMERLFPFTLLLIFLILLLLTFRLFLPALLSVLVVSLALIFTLGLYAACGHRFSMMTSLLPVLLITIGVAESVHILTHNYEELSHGLSQKEALRQTIKRMLRPCLFTSLTTAAGFASFLASGVPVIRLTGLYAALGIMLAFVLSIAVLPAALSLLPPPHRPAERAARGVFTKGLQKLTLFNLRFRRGILLGALTVTAIAVYGTLRVTAESTFLLYIRPSHPVRAVYEFIEANLTGVNNLEILVHTPPDGLKDPDLLQTVAHLEEFVSRQPHVTKTISVVDLLKDINQALHEDDPHYNVVPSTREEIAQYLLLYEMSGGEELRDYLTEDYAVGRMTVLFRSVSSRVLAELERKILTYAQKDLGLSVKTTGAVSLFADMERKLTTSQIRSLAGAFMVITVLMVLLLRSVKLGAIGMIPNIIPLFLLFATMGWAGIHLDVATAIVAGMALGIAVDDTIHYMARFGRELEGCGDYEEAVRRCGATVTRAMVATSAILFSGFIVLTLGNFQGMVNFGLLSSLTMFYALVGDLVLLPALLLVLKPLPGQR